MSDKIIVNKELLEALDLAIAFAGCNRIVEYEDVRKIRKEFNKLVEDTEYEDKVTL